MRGPLLITTLVVEPTQRSAILSSGCGIAFYLIGLLIATRLQLAVVEFASAQALTAWRDHPDHRKAQQRGRNDFYAEYEIINCAVLTFMGTNLNGSYNLPERLPPS